MNAAAQQPELSTFDRAGRLEAFEASVQPEPLCEALLDGFRRESTLRPATCNFAPEVGPAGLQLRPIEGSPSGFFVDVPGSGDRISGPDGTADWAILVEGMNLTFVGGSLVPAGPGFGVGYKGPSIRCTANVLWWDNGAGKLVSWGQLRADAGLGRGKLEAAMKKAVNRCVGGLVARATRKTPFGRV